MKKSRLVFGRYDYAAFLTFIAYATSSLVVPVALVGMAKDLSFPLDEGGMAKGGALQLVRSLSMCLSMAASGFLAARWGNRRVIAAALCMMAAGIFLCGTAASYLLVIPFFLIAGLGEGVVEGLGTPFVQDMHDSDQGRYVNFTHGFWSLGIIISVPLFGIMLGSGLSWRTVMIAAASFSIAPILLLLLPDRGKGYREKKTGVSAGEVAASTLRILKNRYFWLYFAAMFFAGGGEYCLTFWSASFIQLNFAGSALAGGIATAVFSLGMFLGRTGAGAFIRQERLKELIIWAGTAAAAVSCLIPLFAVNLSSFPQWAAMPLVFLLLFLAGLGTAPFWPSIQSLSVDRQPQLDSTMMFILLSCAGVPGCGILTWLMGLAGDSIGGANGFSWSFMIVPASFISMVLLIAASDWRKKQ